MAIKDGFFNAVRSVDPETEEVSFDRVYDNESMNKYFKGLISQNGIFQNVGDRLEVVPGDGLTLVVKTGKALVGAHWVELTAPEVLALEDYDALPDIAYPRWVAVMVRFDATLPQRKCSVYLKPGAAYGDTQGNRPSKPTPDGNNNGNFDQTGQPVEMPLAYVWINRGVTAIAGTDISDWRGTSECPWITHLIRDPAVADTDRTLAKYWDQFHEWYSQVTEEMNINTHMQEFRKVVNGGPGASNAITLDMTDYVYGAGDIFFVYYNGLELIKDVEYTVTQATPESKAVLTFSGNFVSGNTLSIKVLKSVIGTPSYLDGDEVRY